MKLKTAIHQNATEIVDDALHSAYDISYDYKKTLSYKDYAEKARDLEKKIGNLSINEYEDLHWQSLSSKNALDAPLYAIDNNKSLFPNSCQSWNLNRFTYKESIIHRVRKYFIYIFRVRNTQFTFGCCFRSHGNVMPVNVYSTGSFSK